MKQCVMDELCPCDTSVWDYATAVMEEVRRLDGWNEEGEDLANTEYIQYLHGAYEMALLLTVGGERENEDVYKL